jgi:hypothetical protein
VARWLRRFTHGIRGALLALAAACAGPAPAQTIESVLSPGELIQGHARWEQDCARCHVRFERTAQDRLCTDCHKDVGRDMRERTGYHGRQQSQPTCRACHTDHKGRAARIALFDQQRFDHDVSDYPLRGKHRTLVCEKCHESGKKYSEAPNNCNACHRKDDVHKGALGPLCASCHTDNDWKEKARFDHEKTRFALRDKHADAACTACHKKGDDFRAAPHACIGCHKKDDDAPKGHKGLYGERCDSCHGAKAWKSSTFNHDTETKYALRGKHRQAKCGDCHSGHLYRDKLGTACIACHKKDDDGPKGHRGTLGRDCASCHVETGWKEKARFDHDKTQFPLLGRHVDVKCADCHQSTRYKEAPKDCIGCHKKDDQHRASLGTTCESCHVERDWKDVRRFDHDKTRFALRNAHAARTVACKDCHRDLTHYRDTPRACSTCHQKDDRHQGQLGARCDSCHSDRDWKVPRFDHAQTRFSLVGKHAIVTCGGCHESARYKEAPRECRACHQNVDKHKLAFGTACDSCHNARAWGIWSFDHAARARYALDGGHRALACTRCHQAPAPAGRISAEVGTACIGCHRRDDRHDGNFGTACEQCHVVERWQRVRTRVGPAAGAQTGSR